MWGKIALLIKTKRRSKKNFNLLQPPFGIFDGAQNAAPYLAAGLGYCS